MWIASISSEIDKAEQIYQMHDELKIQQRHSRKSNSDDDDNGEIDYEEPNEPQAHPESDGSSGLALVAWLYKQEVASKYRSVCIV